MAYSGTAERYRLVSVCKSAGSRSHLEQYEPYMHVCHSVYAKKSGDLDLFAEHSGCPPSGHAVKWPSTES
jgi:hypothetical protein